MIDFLIKLIYASVVIAAIIKWPPIAIFLIIYGIGGVAYDYFLDKILNDGISKYTTIIDDWDDDEEWKHTCFGKLAD